jgi:hypothetical protein
LRPTAGTDVPFDSVPEPLYPLQDDPMADVETLRGLLTLMGLNPGAVTGGLTKQPGVDVMPSATLESWSARRTPEGYVFLVGYCIERQEGRASTNVVSADAATRTCMTGSGRAYKLLGQPGYNDDAEYVWGRFKSAYGIEEATDVSDSLFDIVFSEPPK